MAVGAKVAAAGGVDDGTTVDVGRGVEIAGTDVEVSAGIFAVGTISDVDESWATGSSLPPQAPNATAINSAESIKNQRSRVVMNKSP